MNRITAPIQKQVIGEDDLFWLSCIGDEKPGVTNSTATQPDSGQNSRMTATTTLAVPPRDNSDFALVWLQNEDISTNDDGVLFPGIQTTAVASSGNEDTVTLLEPGSQPEFSYQPPHGETGEGNEAVVDEKFSSFLDVQQLCRVEDFKKDHYSYNHDSAILPCSLSLMNFHNARIPNDSLIESHAMASTVTTGFTPPTSTSGDQYVETTMMNLDMKTPPRHASCPSHCNGKMELAPRTAERIGLASMRCKTPVEAFHILSTIGSTLRSKADPFFDASTLDDPGARRMARGGVCELFPDRLYRMLVDLEDQGRNDIIGFLPHGRAFFVYKMNEFVKDLLPRYFSDQTKWSSFLRQINFYGFKRVTSGRDIGAYYHELFLQGHPNLVAYMRRVGAQKGLDRRRDKLLDGSDPDFWAMKPINAEKSL